MTDKDLQDAGEKLAAAMADAAQEKIAKSEKEVVMALANIRNAAYDAVAAELAHTEAYKAGTDLFDSAVAKRLADDKLQKEVSNLLASIRKGLQS